MLCQECKLENVLACRVGNIKASQFSSSRLSHVPFPVVWVPDPNLLKLNHQTEEIPDQILSSLEDFNPEEWGLPPYDN